MPPSTLDQPGTKPFHLKALVAPTLERDKEFQPRSKSFLASSPDHRTKGRGPGLSRLRAGIKVSRQIDAMKDGRLAMRVNVTGIAPPEGISEKIFELKGHPGQRALTSDWR